MRRESTDAAAVGRTRWSKGLGPCRMRNIAEKATSIIMHQMSCNVCVTRSTMEMMRRHAESIGAEHGGI